MNREFSKLNFKNWILSESFSSFKYRFPSDKLQQMADFYTLQMLIGRSSFDLKRQQIVADKGIDSYEFGKPRSIDDQPNKEDQLDYVLQEITNELLPKLKQEVLDDVLFSIITEARHAVDENEPVVILNKIKEQLDDQHRKLTRKFFLDFESRNKRYDFDNNFSRKYRDKKDELTTGNDSYIRAYHSFLNSKATPAQFVKISKIMFRDLAWQHSYGGENWVNICEAWDHLNEAKTLQSMFVYIDHIYDIQHNTGSVFSKVRAYASVDEKFKSLLDKKAKINNPLELYDEVSPSMRKILPMAAKFKFGTGLEDFKMHQSSKPEQKSQKLSKSGYDIDILPEMDVESMAAAAMKIYSGLKPYMYDPSYVLPRFCYSVFRHYNTIITSSDEKFREFKNQLRDQIGSDDGKNPFDQKSNFIKERLKRQYSMITNWLDKLTKSLAWVKVNLAHLSRDDMKDIISKTGLNLELKDFDLNDKFKEDLIKIIEEYDLSGVSFIRKTLGISLVQAKYFFIYFHLKFHIEGKCKCLNGKAASHPVKYSPPSSNIMRVNNMMNNTVVIDYIKRGFTLPFVVCKLKLIHDVEFVDHELPLLIKESPYWKGIANYKQVFTKFFHNLDFELKTLSKKPDLSWMNIEYSDKIFIEIFKEKAFTDVKNFFLYHDENNHLLQSMGILFHGMASDKTIEKIIRLLHTKLHIDNLCNCGAKYNI